MQQHPFPLILSVVFSSQRAGFGQGSNNLGHLVIISKHF